MCDIEMLYVDVRLCVSFYIALFRCLYNYLWFNFNFIGIIYLILHDFFFSFCVLTFNELI